MSSLFYMKCLRMKRFWAFFFFFSRLRLYADCGAYAPKIVYTPLNGTGNRPVREILKRIGVKTVTVVPEQELPDGNFTTCPYPNPPARKKKKKKAS